MIHRRSRLDFWVRRTLYACLIGAALYLLSFTFVVKMISGTWGLAGVPRSMSGHASGIPMHPRGIHIHARNNFFKGVYAPLIRPGQALGWWAYHDDAHEHDFGHPLIVVWINDWMRR